MAKKKKKKEKVYKNKLEKYFESDLKGLTPTEVKEFWKSRNKHNYKYAGRVTGSGTLPKSVVLELMQPQAQRIIDKFDSIPNLVLLLNEIEPGIINRTSIYRWTYPKSKGGTGGVIPTRIMPYLLKAARLQGVMLTSDDFYPGRK